MEPRQGPERASPRYGPYRFTQDAALEILLVTTRQKRRWIIPKGWPIKGLRPAKSAAREAFEEAGVRGRIGTKPVGLFTYDKARDEDGVQATCEVKVFPLLVRRQSEVWPESEQRVDVKKLIAAFAKRAATAAALKSIA